MVWYIHCINIPCIHYNLIGVNVIQGTPREALYSNPVNHNLPAFKQEQAYDVNVTTHNSGANAFHSPRKAASVHTGVAQAKERLSSATAISRTTAVDTLSSSFSTPRQSALPHPGVLHGSTNSLSNSTSSNERESKRALIAKAAAIRQISNVGICYNPA